MAVISMKSLFEAGVHYGHKTERWHPKMKDYIYGQKAGIYILDLRKSMQALKDVYNYVYNISSNGGKILFVGTKFQAREIIAEQALGSGNYFVNLRWLGGMMTNFQTVKASIAKLKEIEEMSGPDGDYPGIIKKEAVRFEKERKKLEAVLGGIRDLKKPPAAVFIIDLKRESIALKEAKTLGIPVIAVVDSNCDPRGVDFVIPGNDDSAHAIELYCSVISAASLEGRKAYESKGGVVDRIEDAEEEEDGTEETEEGTPEA
ncbi:MAG: 30S ribosomal protein S2 [Candidatus Lambdaproteobacteria bacterium RIFOXYD1_FULL_56_27]|uniref:Small ribosomal subunit protein uS2 n=1 Tax=Candidatus Lambdaproteobacteria bacterium RIFOXYD2_FULL_56_26 TaxID=1817773 RepID=A0A1F6GLU2_9PROT|nr:MAG: 30S ribosomal protein S2 [Candidatus Lambdaproteobacteria bacterium RIFOXYD2_FULL_56_26]OGH01468.1 MAG: 30S ribosomal protein S2 [Candidatus Lambdaproteobacteria bacterium RIFOXYC1_FULL_56_13]OGH07044.1 MAG: 30S ribosomal protein S2 [Candidatus Lambdaproteobacteria bacterium RIFOXYD1_FULL_56_27]